MRRAAAVLAWLLAGCSSDPVVTERFNEIAENSASSAVGTSPEPARQIGTTSVLSARTSALTGIVSDFLVERTATETRVALAADTLFAFDKADLTPAAQANLQRTADLVRDGAAGAVTVSGYTDARGEPAYNLDLSQRRAAAIAAWLRKQAQLATRTFTVVGRGEAEPVAPNAKPDGSDDPDGRARNRRVVVVFPR